jgi:hypothetical protein
MMKRNKALLLPIALGLMLITAQPDVRSAANSDLYIRLQSTRDALIAQERDLHKSYDDVGRQIDSLRQKQATLESYMAQTRSAIRDVERAMGNAQ